MRGGSDSYAALFGIFRCTRPALLVCSSPLWQCQDRCRRSPGITSCIVHAKWIEGQRKPWGQPVPEGRLIRAQRSTLAPDDDVIAFVGCMATPGLPQCEAWLVSFRQKAESALEKSACLKVKSRCRRGCQLCSLLDGTRAPRTGYQAFASLSTTLLWGCDVWCAHKPQPHGRWTPWDGPPHPDQLPQHAFQNLGILVSVELSRCKHVKHGQ